MTNKDVLETILKAYSNRRNIPLEQRDTAKYFLENFDRLGAAIDLIVICFLTSSDFADYFLEQIDNYSKAALAFHVNDQKH